MTTQWIDMPVSGPQTFSGYLALPPTGSGPGLVLIQEIWGVNAHIRQVAQQYALDGYVVLAPDVFWRQQYRVDLDYDTAGSERAFALLKGEDLERAGNDMVAALEHLRSRPEVTGKVGVMGFCMGGHLAYRVAASGKADAAVSYYGGGIQNNLHLAGDVRQPMLFHYAGEDRLIPAEAVASVREAFKDNSQVTIHDYPGVDHGFNCWSRPSYNQQAAALAHGRTLEFLASHLG